MVGRLLHDGIGETEVEPVDENVGQLDSDGKLLTVELGELDGEPLGVCENVAMAEAEGEPLADALALALADAVLSTSCRFLLKPVLTSSISVRIRIFFNIKQSNFKRQSIL
jgi:hypothetical protein